MQPLTVQDVVTSEEKFEAVRQPVYAGPASKSVIEISNVSKRFDQFVAVRDLSFTVKEGSIFGLLGPNGAGKTTTIRMIIDIIAPDSGEIRVLGQKMSSGLQQQFGYLPEERGLYRRMKIGEQLSFFGQLKGLSASEAEKRIDVWLERLGLSDWKKKRAFELSKGMQQKVQFIATVLHDPQVLILDEPFSGLDPVSTQVLKKTILDLRDQGKTIIFSTHQMEQVEQMCEDICLINRATKVLGGRLRDIKRQFGRNAVILAYEGPEAFLSDPRIGRCTRFANHVEILPSEGVDPQVILQLALAEGGRVSRFELMEPSLNDIFIETVSGGQHE